MLGCWLVEPSSALPFSHPWYDLFPLLSYWFLLCELRSSLIFLRSSYRANLLKAGLTARQTSNAEGQNAIIAMVFLFQMGYSSTWTPLSFSYCASWISQFVIRAWRKFLRQSCWVSIDIFFIFYNIFTSSAGFIIPIGLENRGWRYVILVYLTLGVNSDWT